MSDFHGGFLIEKTDPSIHPVVFELAARYCDEHDLPKDRHALSWITREGLPFYLLVVTVDGVFAGRETEAFVQDHQGLAGQFAAALNCDVWAYTYNNQAGAEFATRYDSDGTKQEELGGLWDDGARFIPTLAERYDIPLTLLETDLIYGTLSASAPLHDHCDTDLLAHYERNLIPVPKHRSNGIPTRLFLTSVMLDDLLRLAQARDCSVDDVVYDAWQLSKNDLAKIQPPDPVEPPEFEPAELRLKYGEDSMPTTLDVDGPKVSFEFHLDPKAREEMHILAVHLDRSNSWLLQQAYAASRARLYSF